MRTNDAFSSLIQQGPTVVSRLLEDGRRGTLGHDEFCYDRM